MPVNPRRYRSSVLSAVAAILSVVGVVQGARVEAQSLPSRIGDSTFWRMVTEMSEPGGYFRSDNLVGNEASLQYVIPELQRITRPGGAYIGVAPDQNFTYIVALRPKIAFICDIRRGAMLQHLMYKALIELSADRADFLARLFSRRRPPGLDTASSVNALVAAFARVAPDSAYYTANMAAIRDQLTRTHGFALTAEDFNGIAYVYDAFYYAGPALTYNYPNAGGGFGRGMMPSYSTMLMETDGAGLQRSYLATEANYRVLRAFQTSNLLVPLTGDFAGPRALRGIGTYLKDHGASVTAFYTSNVEQYLFQQNDDWARFYRNVGTLPIDSTSMFIRSYSAGGMYRASPNGRSAQLTGSIAELLKAFAEGRIRGYYDVIQMSK
jgi:hypothetical protein